MTNDLQLKKIIVAIDGNASSGKSTMAKWLAAQTGYVYIDTGAMYRAIALHCLRNGLMTADTLDTVGLQKQISNIHIEFKPNATGKSDTFLNGENVENTIRTLDVGAGASRVSELKFVRAALVAQQQAMGRQKGIVMDGRDIGTVVFPEAELKIFVTATPEVRARRRYDELIAKGENVSYNEVLQATVERDNRDTSRTESPLRQAADALVLDSSEMTLEEQREWLMRAFEEKINVCNCKGNDIK